MRRLLRDSWDRDALTHFAAEEAALARTAATADAGEAFTAFLAKRPATFEGK